MYLRFVRLKNNEYRFAEVSFHVDHAMLAQEQPVESAGFVKIYEDEFDTEGHSMSLKMGMDGKDNKLLSELLGLPVKEYY